MKQQLPCQLLLLFLLTSFISIGQGKHVFTMTVRDYVGPKAGLPVTAVNQYTYERKVWKTGPDGSLVLEFVTDTAAKWLINVGEMKGHNVIEYHEGSTGSGMATIFYDPERWVRQNEAPVDRTNLVLDEEPQRLPPNSMPGPKSEIVEVKIVNRADRAYGGVPVKMTCFELGLSYTADTDATGIARFKLPLNHKFQIDLDGEDNFEFYDTGEKPSIRITTLTYERLNFDEVVNNDGYIEQIFKSEPRPISNRVMVRLQVFGGPNGGSNEDVFIQTDYSKKKYHGVSNSNGELIFMLPKRHTYHVGFKFQEDAAVLDLSRFFGIGQMQQGIDYVSDPRLQFPERYLPTKDDRPSYDINNFNPKVYADTPDDNLINVHVKWGNNKINSGSKEALLELGFSVKEPTNKAAVSKPLNIAFVLDKSGSMSGEKIDFLKAAMLDLVEKLRPIDNVSLVYFDTQAVLAYESQKVNKSHLKDIIYALEADGGTSILEGLKIGYSEVHKNMSANTVNRVILLTDGYGSQPVETVIEQSKKYFEKGISVSTIGVGEGYNAAMLKLLSQYSGGLVHQAIDHEGITKALEGEFESLLYPLASDLRVKVKYNNRVIYKTIYGIPEKSNTNSAVTFELDRVYSSLNKMALMKFKIENPDRDIDKDKIQIIINYYDETKKQDVEIVKETNLEWTDETDVEMIYDTAQKRTYSVAVINQTMKVIADYCDAKNYGEAKSTINATLKSLKKLNGDKYAPDMIPMIEKLREYLTALDRAIANN